MAEKSIELKVVNSSGKALASREVSAAIFDCTVNPGVLHQVVRWQRASKRAGTHSVLNRAIVSGGGVKPWNQKGTGRARAGSNSSPLWVGGGIAHGPKPRSYSFSVNKKERKKALCAALTLRNKAGQLMVLKEFAINEIKTKKAQEVLNSIGVKQGQATLVVLSANDEMAIKSLRNLARVKTLQAAAINVYDILNAKHVVVTDAALSEIEARLA